MKLKGSLMRGNSDSKGSRQRRQGSGTKQTNPETGTGKEPEVPYLLRLEPYEGKLSRMVLRREGAEQSALTQPTAANV
jgi:hypothetical protein